MDELQETLNELTTREKIEQAVLAGAAYATIKDQKALAELVGTSYSNTRRILLSMTLVGRRARKLGTDPRTIRKRIQQTLEERAAAALAKEAQLTPNGATRGPQELQAAEKYVAQVALDARDPVQRLELYNALATNARGDIPPAVQVAALSKISDESAKAGEAFGIPAPSNDEEETTRVLAVLQSAQLHCSLAAIAKFQEAQVVPSQPESASAEEVQTPEAPPSNNVPRDAPDSGGVGGRNIPLGHGDIR